MDNLTRTLHMCRVELDHTLPLVEGRDADKVKSFLESLLSAIFSRVISLREEYREDGKQWKNLDIAVEKLVIGKDKLSEGKLSVAETTSIVKAVYDLLTLTAQGK